MEKGRYQKLKLFYLLDILKEYTDEDNVLEVNEIIKLLADNAIVVERKTLYKDLELLEEYGFDIVTKKEGRKNTYALIEREFELAEVKMLIDVIQASKFLTAKKSHDLIIKLKKLVSKNEAQKIQRQVYSYEENKYINEKIYYNVDAIHNAIASDKQISFKYWQWNYQKKMINRKNDQIYKVSPFALIWSDENYYMVAFDEKAGIIKNYRVDKMRNVSITLSERIGYEEFKNENISNYSKTIFSMYGGELSNVTLRFSEYLIGVLVDRFGNNIVIHKIAEDVYEATVQVMVSNHFLGWIFSLGEGIEIVGPEVVKEKYIGEIEKLINKYSNKDKNIMK